jgi:hypothetical protein
MLIRGVMALQSLWCVVLIALGVRSYAYRHSLEFMQGSTSLFLSDVLNTYGLVACAIAVVIGLLRYRRWGRIAAIILDVAVVGIPPLVLRIWIYFSYPEAAAASDFPMVSLMSLGVASLLALPGMRGALV